MSLLTADDIGSARNELSQIRASQSRLAKPKTSGRGGFLSSLISEAGGLGGAGIGGLIGSALLPGIGTALGAGVGGFFGGTGGKAIENKVRDDQNFTGEGGSATASLSEGALEGIFSMLPVGKLLKGATKPLRAGGKLLTKGISKEVAEEGVEKGGKSLLGRVGKTGERMIASQSKLTGAQARKFGIRPVDTIGRVNKRTGLTSLDDMAELSQGLTGGKDSLLDVMTRGAVDNTSGVNFTTDLQKTARRLITKEGATLKPSLRKDIVEQIKNAKVSMYGGEAGSLSTLANPKEALDQANNFRSMAKNLSTGFNVTPENRSLAKVYNGLAGEMEDAIYKSPGVNDIVPAIIKSGSDDLLFKAQDLRKVGNNKLAGAYEKIAQELKGVKDVKALRTFKRDFVDLSKIDKATAEALGARSFGGADASNLAGKFARNPLNIFGAPLDAITPRMGGMLTKVGNRGAGEVAEQATKQATSFGNRSVGGLMARVGAGSLLAPNGDEQPDELSQVDGFGEEEQPIPDQQSVDPMGKLKDAAEKALAAGDIKAFNEILGAAESYQKMQSAFGGGEEGVGLTAAQATRAAAAQNALNDIPQISQAIESGKLGGLKGLPGSGTAIGRRLLGTEDLDSALFNIADNILRARSGAATPEAEVKRFMETFLPAPTDSKQAKQAKLERAVRELEGFLNPQQAALPDFGGASDGF